MIPMTVVGGTRWDARSALEELRGAFAIQMVSPDELSTVPPAGYTLVDIDDEDTALVTAVKKWLERKPAHAKVILATEPEWLSGALGCTIGATDVIYRPIASTALLDKVWGEILALAGDPLKFPGRKKAPGIAAAADALKDMFAAACFGSPLETKVIETSGDSIVAQLEAQGLHAWIDAVRSHHSQTYQHCLLVTGVAVAFGQHIGLSWVDRHRLSVAGMLHDIGKARVPVTILEKAEPLNEAEMAVMRRHPEYGLAALANVRSLHKEMLDIVIHHHEYLDGSGYPHGLSGQEISDLVRIITIADVFGALIERRAYKAPLSNDEAYQMLLDMGPKLDKDLVREFRGCVRSMESE